MNETVQYKLTYYGQGDVYSAEKDLDRMVVIDNQLNALSTVVGNGVLSGWNISYAGGLEIEVSPGSGMIGKIFSKTITEKTASVEDNAQNSVFIQNNAIPATGPLNIEVEGPRSNFVFATYVDLVAPAAPTGLVASASTYLRADLIWDLNSDPDMDHYQVERDTNIAFPSPVMVGSPTSNGTALEPFYDETVQGSTTNPPVTQVYYYRVKAVDVSGNVGLPSATSSVTMPLDTHSPTNPSSLSIYAGDSSVSGYFLASPSSDLASYRVVVERLNSDGTIHSTPYDANIGNILTFYAPSLTNGFRHRVTVFAINAVGNQSPGLALEFTPSAKSAPLDPASLSATGGSGYIQLSWTASPSPTGSSVGQKASYRLRIVQAGVESSPVDVGLVTSYQVTSYVATSGQSTALQEGRAYYFRLSTVDAFGNESSGRIVRSTTLFVTQPKNPSSFYATPSHESVLLSWVHSSSSDVEGYNISYDVGGGFVPDVEIGYVESYELTGLTNDVQVTARIRARSINGPISSGVLAVSTPEADETPPEFPKNFSPWAKDKGVFLSWDDSPSSDVAYYVVKRTAVAEPPWIPPSMELTELEPPVEMNVGLANSLVDTGLTNGQTYSYEIKAVDTRGNDSDYDLPFLVVPTPGLNVLSATSNEAAAYAPYEIVFNWTHDTILTSGYNVYRSTDPLAGYELIDTVKATPSATPVVVTYHDQDYQNLQNGVTYYYSVSPARDNSDVVVTSDGSTPANSVLIGTVLMSSGTPTITDEKRVVANLTGTAEDYEYLILRHQHSTAPYNAIPVQATEAFDLIDVVNLKDIDFSLLSLSEKSLEYYRNLMYDPETGTPIEYPVRQIYVPHPVAMVYNLPYVGDFQLLIDNDLPPVEFSINPELNAVVFTSSISSSYSVSVDGRRLSFYVAAQLDEENRSYSVLVDGSTSTSASLDREKQTVRFGDDSSRTDVYVVVEPFSPLYNTKDGAQTVSLWPNAVINDFTTDDGRIYTSQNGGWDENDLVEARIDGEKTEITYAADASTKTITFEAYPGNDSEVTLLVYDKGETQGLLPEANIAGLDASAFRKGDFTDAQLSSLSHEGRISEPMSPSAEIMGTVNYFDYSPSEGIGTAITPYSYWSDNLGFSVLGTSSGLLKSYGFGSQFVSSKQEAEFSLNYGVRPLAQPGLMITDDGIEAELVAREFSGRFPGYIRIGSSYVRQPSLALISPTQVLMAGGYVYYVSPNMEDQHWTTPQSCYIYDSTSSSWSSTGDLIQGRADHSLVALSGGDIVAMGGVLLSSDGQSVVPICSCESYSAGTWSRLNSMRSPRSFHSANVLSNPERVLVAGGSIFGSEGTLEITSSYDAVAKTGSTFSYTATASGLPDSFSFYDYPGWMTAAGSVLSAAVVGAAGTYYVRVRANRTSDYYIERTLRVTVVGPPSITSSSSVHGAVGRRILYSVETSGSISSIVSSSTYFGSMKGPLISFVPVSQGTGSISTVVTDSFGATSSVPLSVVVHPSFDAILECGSTTGESGFGQEGLANAETLIFDCSGVDVGASGDFYFVDKKYFRVRKSSSGIVTTVAGNGLPGYTSGPAAATTSKLNPEYVKLDPSESYLYISDRENGVIQQVDLGTGIMTTFAGNGAPGLSAGDGGAATAATISPSGIFVTSTDLYICDHYVSSSSSSSNSIRKVNIGTGIITTVAGAGPAGSSGDGGLATAALLDAPSRICVNGSEFYISDSGNHKIRKVDSFGVITTVVGSSVGEDDGTESVAATSLVTDVGDLFFSGDLFHVSFGSDKSYIRRLNSGISTIVAELSGAVSSLSPYGTSFYASVGDLSQLWSLELVSSISSTPTPPSISSFLPTKIYEGGGETINISASGVSEDTRVFLAVDQAIEATSVSYSNGVLRAIMPACPRPAFSRVSPANFTLILLSENGATYSSQPVIVSPIHDEARPAFAISGGNYSVKYAASKAFDGNPTTYWAGIGGMDDWIGQDFGANPKLIGRIRWLTYSVVSRNATSVDVDYSDDGTSWTNLATIAVSSAASSWVEIFFSHTEAHRAWRVKETTVATNWVVSEMEMEAYASSSGATRSCELLTTSDWSLATSMARASANHESKYEVEKVVVTQQAVSPFQQAYDVLGNYWLMVDPSTTNESSDELDGVVKQIIVDSGRNMFVLTNSSVYLSVDNAESFKRMDGLDNCEVVHKMLLDSSGDLYAAADVGVYFLADADKLSGRWSQTSLLGSSTTETSGLCEFGGKIWATTEVGAFSTSDQGASWVLEKELPDCHLIVHSGGTTSYLASGSELYRTDDDGTSWTRMGEYEFLERGCFLVSRSGVDLLLGTGTGIYRSLNGQDFELMQFSKNKSGNNSVTMVELSGSDVMVGFGESIYVVDPSGRVRLIDEFSGIVPTIQLNGVESKTGWRFDVQRKKITFEYKRAASDEVGAITEYSLYTAQNGGWYDARPDGPVQVLVNGYPYLGDVQINGRTGQVAFQSSLSKGDVVHVTVPGTTFYDSGERFHSELEDSLERQTGNMDMLLGRKSSCNMLQMGISVEHNFLERGLERNGYEGTETLVDRSFNSFLENSDFFIMGRKEYDEFNSTIDYRPESSSSDTGARGLVVLSSYLKSSTELWVGTEDGIVVLDPTSSFQSTSIIRVGGNNNTIRHIRPFNDWIVVVSSLGLFYTDDDGATFNKLYPNYLPSPVYLTSSSGTTLIAGTSGAIYYSDNSLGDPRYGDWTKAQFLDESNEVLFVNSACTGIVLSSGYLIATVGGSIFASLDGKRWYKRYSMPSPAPNFFWIESFSGRIFLASDKGIYSDKGSILSYKPTVSLERIEGTDEDSEFVASHLWASSSTIYAVGDRAKLYSLQNESWGSETLPGVSSAQHVTTASTTKVVFSGNVVLTG